MSDPFAPSEKRDYHKFENVGDTVVGIIDKIDEVQEKDYDTGDPVTWPDGRPRMIYVLEVRDTTSGEVKALWARGNMITAIREASREVGHGPLGHLLKLKYHEDGKPSNPRFKPPKLFKAKIEPAPADAAPRKEAPPADPFGGYDEEPF